MLDMAVYREGKQNPTVTIRAEEMTHLEDLPNDKFGLSELTRQKIYKQLHQIDEKATAEAEEKEPSIKERQWELTYQLIKTYQGELAEKYNLTEDQLHAIADEGLASPWIPE
jgi:hypothetical protein